jgi:hypothetical protein
MERVDQSAFNLIASFTDRNARLRAHQLSNAMFGLHLFKGGKEESLALMADFASGLDALAVVCCVLFAEAPPPPKQSSVSLEKDFNRRVSIQTANATKAGLKLDIERLFAQQIKIFDREGMTTPSLDAILGTVLRACFKCAQENSRLVILSVESHLRVHAEVTFVKHINSSLLRDPAGCDALADQVISSLSARLSDDYRDGSSSSSWGSSGYDGNEIAFMAKVAADCIAAAGARSVLLPRN